MKSAKNRAFHGYGHAPLLAVASALLAGCVSQRAGMPAVTLGRLTAENLEATDYEPLVETEGRSSGGCILFLLDFGDEPATYVPPATPREEADTPLIDGKTMTAVFRAIDRVPGANAVLKPLVTRYSAHFLFWSSWEVTVQGTAVRILKTSEDAP